MTPQSTRSAAWMGRLRIVIFLCLGLFCVATFWVISRSFWIEYRSIRGGPSDIPEPTQAGLPAVTEVSWSTGGKTIRGWLARGHRPQAVVLVHGTGGNRLSAKDELIILANAGFTVLVYDQPGHGQSDGPTSYSAQRREVLKDAVRLLKSQGGVEKVGALGLSYGGYDLIQAARGMPEIESLVVAGAPGDLLAHAHYEYQGAFGLRLLGARLAMALLEVPLGEASAETVVGQLSPRPILFLHGARDFAVPRELAARLYESARPPKRWIELPHSGHCDYASHDRDLYAKVLLEFFSEGTSQL